MLHWMRNGNGAQNRPHNDSQRGGRVPAPDWLPMVAITTETAKMSDKIYWILVDLALAYSVAAFVFGVCIWFY